MSRLLPPSPRSRHLCTVRVLLLLLLYGRLCGSCVFCWFIPLAWLAEWLTGWLVDWTYHSMRDGLLQCNNTQQPIVYNNVYIHNLFRTGFNQTTNNQTDQIQGKPKSMPTMFTLNKITKTFEQRWTHQAKKWRLLQGFIR